MIHSNFKFKFFLLAAALVMNVGVMWGNTLEVTPTDPSISNNTYTLGGNHVSFYLSGSMTKTRITALSSYYLTINKNSTVNLKCTVNGGCTINVTGVEVVAYEMGVATSHTFTLGSGNYSSSQKWNYSEKTLSISGFSYGSDCSIPMTVGGEQFQIRKIKITYTITPDAPTISNKTASIDVTVNTNDKKTVDYASRFSVSDASDFTKEYTKSGGDFDGNNFYATSAGTYTITSNITAKGDCHVASRPSNPLTITVNLRTASLSLSATTGTVDITNDKNSPNYFDLSSLVSSYTGNGWTASVVSSNSSTGFISGSKFYGTAAGQYTIRLSSAQDDQYKAITPQDVVITVKDKAHPSFTPNYTAAQASGLNVSGTISNAFTIKDVDDNLKVAVTTTSIDAIHNGDAVISYDKASNMITALNAGTATIKFTQPGSSTLYEGESSVFTFTVSKISNTLAIKSAQTILVDGAITNVYSGNNSDATITPSISIESINDINNGDGQVISYDLSSNTITAHNAGVATLTLTQPATYKYTDAEKIIKVTVTKLDNHIYIDGTADSRTYTKTYDEGQSVALTATNTDYTGSPLTVSENSNPDIATYANGQIKTYHTAGSASWTVSQPENYKYKAATATFTANIGNVAETKCYVLKNDVAEAQYSYGKYGDAYSKDFSYDVDADGDTLSINVWKYSSSNDIGITVYGYDASGNQSTIHSFSIGDMNTDATNYVFPVAANIRKIRVQNGGGAWASCSTLNTYASEVRVTRKTYLTADDVTYSNTRYPDGDAISANLVVNWSESNGGDIRILCDNPKFTLSQTTITNTSCNGGTTTIPVSYTSTEAGEHTANITIYNNVRRITCTMTATTVKRDQVVTWATNIDQLPLNKEVESPVTTTVSDHTLTSSDPNIIEVTSDGHLLTKAVGKVTITVSNDGNDKYNAVSASKEIEVTEDAVQYIVWDQNLMNLQLGDETVTLNAYATSEIEGCKTNPENGGSRPITYYESSNSQVVSVSGNILTVVAAGTATLTATQVGGDDTDGHRYAATSAVKQVIVSDPSSCGDHTIYTQAKEVRLDLGWNSIDDDEETSEIDLEGNEPEGFDFNYKGEKHGGYYNGSLYVDQYVNDTWSNVLSLGSPNVSTYSHGEGTFNRAATKIRFRASGKTGYFYYTDLKIKLATYLEAATNQMSWSNTKVGSQESKEITIKFSDVKGNITISSSNELFVVDKETVTEACGDKGSFTLTVTYKPTKATNGNKDMGIITITDQSKTLLISVSGESSVTNRAIEWNHADETDVYTIQTETLSATAYTTDGFHSEAGSVSFSVEGTSTASASISAENVLSFTSAGKAYVTVQTVPDAQYNPASNITKTWNVSITPTEANELPTVADEITYADNLTLAGITLNGGSAKNTIDGAAVEGTYAWTDNTIVPSLGTANYGITFTPANTDMYSGFTSEVSVYVNRPYEVAFTGGDNTMDNESFKTDEQKALTANTLTKTIKVTYNEDGGSAIEDNSQDATFTGWKDASDNSYTDQQTVKNLSTEGGTVTLTAQWTTEAITLPTTSKDGYTFLGWYNGDDKIESPYTPTADIELTAKWSSIEYAISYTDEQGAENTNPTSYTIESEDITLSDLSKEGYTFLGWTYNGQTTPGKGVKILKGSTGDKSFTANWQINTYTITWKNGEETLKTDEVEYGATPSYSGETPTKAEDEQYTYTFSGWDPAISTVTGAATYTAQFTATVKSYTVTTYYATATDGDNELDVVYNITRNENGTLTYKARVNHNKSALTFAVNDGTPHEATEAYDEYSWTSTTKYAEGATVTGSFEMTYPDGTGSVNFSYTVGSSNEQVDRTFTVNNNTYKYASLYLSYPTEIPDGLTAYTGTLSDDETLLYMSEITGGILPALTPVVVKMSDASSYTFTENENASNSIVSDNSMQGTLIKRTPVAANSEKVIVTFGVKNGVIGFRKSANSDGSIGANKVFMEVTPAENSAPVRIIFGATAPTSPTALDENEGDNNAEKFFLDGKFFIRRNGRIFDLSGHLVK